MDLRDFYAYFFVKWIYQRCEHGLFIIPDPPLKITLALSNFLIIGTDSTNLSCRTI